MATYGFSTDGTPKRTETMMPVLPDDQRNIKVVCVGSTTITAPAVTDVFKARV